MEYTCEYIITNQELIVADKILERHFLSQKLFLPLGSWAAGLRFQCFIIWEKKVAYALLPSKKDMDKHSINIY